MLTLWCMLWSSYTDSISLIVFSALHLAELPGHLLRIYLLLPAGSDRRIDDVLVIIPVDATDKENWKVMLDSGKLGVIDSRPLADSSSLLVEVDSYWIKS